jgi:hypothetical protein
MGNGGNHCHNRCLALSAPDLLAPDILTQGQYRYLVLVHTQVDGVLQCFAWSYFIWFQVNEYRLKQGSIKAQGYPRVTVADSTQY